MPFLIDYMMYNQHLKQSTLYGISISTVNLKPLEILDIWCMRYGTSVMGNQLAMKKALAISQKVPVLVHPIQQIYFFQTISAKDHQCIWINAKNIIRVQNQGCDTLITFSNQHTLLCPTGKRTILKQIQRCGLMEQSIIKQLRLEQTSLLSRSNL
jgi:competence protein ComK